MKITKKVFSLLIIISILLTCACGQNQQAQVNSEAKEVSVLILPHFEIGEMAGDVIGEAQLYYEEYLMNAEEYTTSDGTIIYYNPENKVAMSIPGYGKVNTAIAETAVLSDERFDYSKAYVFSTGCAGGAAGYTVFGDVVLETAVCDFDLGHSIDSTELSLEGSPTWFHDVSFDTMDSKKFNKALLEKAYDLTKDIKLQTTEIAKATLERNFAGEEWINREPQVIKGTATTSDNYWKGEIEHQRALDIVSYYGCEDPYALTEMEDMTTANVCERFGLLDRLVIIRGSVNVDVFIDDAFPEKLWDESFNWIEDVSESNEETLDIFTPAMENIFAVGKTIIDAMLNESL